MRKKYRSRLAAQTTLVMVVQWKHHFHLGDQQTLNGLRRRSLTMKQEIERALEHLHVETPHSALTSHQMQHLR